jgi:hypothetical protein
LNHKSPACGAFCCPLGQIFGSADLQGKSATDKGNDRFDNQQRIRQSNTFGIAQHMALGIAGDESLRRKRLRMLRHLCKQLLRRNVQRRAGQHHRRKRVQHPENIAAFALAVGGTGVQVYQYGSRVFMKMGMNAIQK